MRRSAALAVGGVVVLVLVLAGSGCGVSGVARVDPPAPFPAGQSIYLQPLQDDPSLRPRWRDVADYPYAESFRSGFSYAADTVELRYTTGGGPLQFTVSAPARSLKPNFCYQMKLWGPLAPWPADPQASNFTNWALGTSGRWSDGLSNLLFRNADLGAHVGERMRGYLYFDFFVTSPDGSAAHTATLDNSFHVTWKTSQREKTNRDGPTRTYPVAAWPDGWAYDRRYPRVKAYTYGEGEPRRPRPGKLALPAGSYREVEFVLTEESFHSRLADGGCWRTVLAARLPALVVP